MTASLEGFERSSGNEFLDLGFSPEKAADYLIRVDLMLEIRAWIKEHGYTQKEAAKHLGVKQPVVSDIVKKKFKKFSIDRLVVLLHRIGKQVDTLVSDRQAA